jgi:hypothetical protein
MRHRYFRSELEAAPVVETTTTDVERDEEKPSGAHPHEQPGDDADRRFVVHVMCSDVSLPRAGTPALSGLRLALFFR